MAMTTIPFFGSIDSELTMFGQRLTDVENLVPLGQGLRAMNKGSVQGGLGAITDIPPTGGIQVVESFSAANQIALPVGDEDAVLVRHSDRLGQDGLFEAVGTESPDDSKYIVAGGGVVGEYWATLRTYETPSSAANWQLKLRYRVDDNKDGEVWAIKFWLYEGATIRVGPTTIAQGVVDADPLVDTTEGTDGWVTHVETFTGNVAWGTGLILRVQMTTIGDAVDKRATSDVNTEWKDQAGAGGAIFSAVSAGTPSDATYVVSPTIGWTGESADYELKFSLTDPLAHRDDPYNLVTVRYKKPQAGNALRVRLYSGTDQIHEETLTTSAVAAFADATITLTAEEFNSIEDWANLRLVFRVIGGSPGVSLVLKSLVAQSTYNSANMSAFPGGALHDAVATDDTSYIYVNGAYGTAYARFALANYEWPGVDTNHSVKGVWLGSVLTTINNRIQFLNSSSLFETVWEKNYAGAGAQSFSEVLLPQTVAKLKGKTVYWLIDGFNGVNQAEVDFLQFEVPETTKVYISDVKLTALPDARACLSWAELQTPASALLEVEDSPTIIAGDQNDLYEVGEDGTWAEISKVAGGYGAGAALPKAWNFLQWGDDVLATNYVDPVQIRVGNAGDFADLMTSTKKPRCQFLIPVRNQVMALNTAGETEAASDGVWWSAVDDARDFDPSVSTQCDHQRLRDTPGQITGGVGGSDAVIFKASSIYLAEYIGPPDLFSFETISTAVGTEFPRSIVSDDRDVYFYTGSSFAVLKDRRGPPKIISDASIDRMLRGNSSHFALKPGATGLSTLAEHTMFGAMDPSTKTIWWFYRSNQSIFFVPPSGAPPVFQAEPPPWSQEHEHHLTALVYNPRTEQWTRVHDESVAASALVTLGKFDHTGLYTNRGLLGLRLNYGGIPQHFLLSSSETLPAFILSGVFGTGAEAQIRRVRPVYWSDAPTTYPHYVSAGYVSGQENPNYFQHGSEVPGTEIVVHASETPMFAEGQYQISSSQQRDRDGWYTVRATGEWFRIGLSIPASQNRRTQEISAFQVDLGDEGES